MERAEALAENEYKSEEDLLRLLRVLQTGADALLKKKFSRIQVAKLPESQCILLRRMLNRALDFALAQLSRREGYGDDIWGLQATIYIEIIWLAVRLDPENACDIVQRA